MKNTAAAAAAARLSAADLQSPQTHKVKQMPIIEAGFEDESPVGESFFVQAPHAVLRF